MSVVGPPWTAGGHGGYPRRIMAATQPDGIRVYAPGSIGNIGPGLDILGMAVSGAGDIVVAERAERPGVVLLDPGHPDLPDDPTQHTASLAAREVLRRAGIEATVGLALRVTKGLPLSSGQGGSAASAVAGAVAANELVGRPLGRRALLDACLVAEEVVAGRHLDNVAPSLLGGIVLIRALDPPPPDIVPLPVPKELVVVLARPAQRLRTAEGRAVLPERISREDALHQAAQVGAMVAALAIGDYALLGRAIQDRIAEPARAHLLPGFVEGKAAALAAGALGASISGSGPTAFALAPNRRTAEEIAEAMSEAYLSCGIACEVRVAEVDRGGARVLPTMATPSGGGML